MQKEIHPTYNVKAKASCACGAIFAVGSTTDDIKVEICSECHPFYTGNEKVLDTAGRVDKFRKKLEASAKIVKVPKKAKTLRPAQGEKTEEK